MISGGIMFVCLTVLLLTTTSSVAQCPGDSHYDVTGQECRCLKCPEKPLCLDGTRLELLHRGRPGSPGRCCDDFGCVPVLETDSDCVRVICPHGEPLGLCPSDSILVQQPDSSQVQRCCGASARCVCNPAARCPVPSCPHGQKVNVTKRGNKLPGSCCDSYTCLLDRHSPSRRNVSANKKTGCAYDGSHYGDGESWLDGNCTECQCKNGLAFCKHTLCGRLTCEYPVVKQGECCAVCEGCLAPDGVARIDSEEWREDDCVQCRCQNGHISCSVEECQTRCSKSYKIPGQCCPVCDDPVVESFVLQPAHCAPLGNCKRLCTHGYTKHVDGCFRCECQVENCSLTCEFGYQTDPVSGEGFCECLKNSLDVVQNISSDCLNVTSCNSSCRLSQAGPNGCGICECGACPQFRMEDCSQDCAFGYKFDGNNCLTCHCIEPPATTESSPNASEPTTTPRPTFASPPSCEHSQENFIPWIEGCHECVCYGKKKMCDVLLTSQTNPAEQPAENTCNDKTDGEQVRLLLPGFCEAAAATRLSCTECICSSGVMYCAELGCPFLSCRGQLVQKPNQCCPSCEFHRPPVDTNSTTTVTVSGPPSMDRRKVGCQIHDKIRDSGDTWWDNPCRACSCTDGAVKCSNVKCPKLDCAFATVQKGRCCPFCFNSSSAPDAQCRFGKETYNTGEVWSQPGCLICTCTDGSILCQKSETCDENNGEVVESFNRQAGRVIMIILAVTSSFGLSIVAVIFLIKRCRRHPSDNRGHEFSPIATYDDPVESQRQNRRAPSKTRPNTCFSLP